jgi:hypothetical protein
MLQDTDPADELALALSLPRAVVLLTVPWSVPERVGQRAFREAACKVVGVTFCILDEEAPAVQAWLSSLGLAPIGGGHAKGAGSILWLERGRVVAFEMCAASMGVAGIIAGTKKIWADEALNDP